LGVFNSFDKFQQLVAVRKACGKAESTGGRGSGLEFGRICSADKDDGRVLGLLTATKPIENEKNRPRERAAVGLHSGGKEISSTNEVGLFPARISTERHGTVLREEHVRNHSTPI